jgi:hypothetical protein
MYHSVLIDPSQNGLCPASPPPPPSSPLHGPAHPLADYSGRAWIALIVYHYLLHMVSKYWAFGENSRQLMHPAIQSTLVVIM